MERIVPCLWFDTAAEEAATFYASVFPAGRIVEAQRYPTEGLPDFLAHRAGEAMTVDVELAGQRFSLLNGGPEFRPNPTVSFMISFDPTTDPNARAALDALWAALMDGGRALMPLQAYPFSEHYGWVEDRYGVSWQLMLTGADGADRPSIVPCLLFGNTVQGRASEAAELYTTVFGGQLGTLLPYPEGPAAGQVMFGDFQLFGQWFALMDAADSPDSFTCGVSLMVFCHGQEELDRYWDALTAVPEAEACGWLADKFGLSWQLVPDNLGELMAKPGASDKLFSMKKIDIAAFG